MGVSWLDVGSWPSYGDTLDADASGNRSNGPVAHIDSSNILSVTEDPDHLIATIGCEDLNIVHSDRVTLVCPRDRAQDVKAMVDAVEEDRRRRALSCSGSRYETNRCRRRR